MQKTDRFNNLIVSDASGNVLGATGTAGTSTAEQPATAKAYRPTDAPEDLDKYVGKQVSVTGLVEERPSVATGADASDLAKIDVETIQQLSDVCGVVR